MVPQFNEFERLFLLEFFVDYVNIQDTSFKYIDSTMCVSFQFLRYPVMRVCEASFTPWPKMAKVTKVIFKSGKSCLFSVHSDQSRTIPSEFNLKIVVCQRMKCSDDRQHLGEAVVSLGHSFINLLQPPPNMAMPATGMRHDLFPLKDPMGKVIGSVAAFARISCFGKLIVTQFQLAQEQDVNYMFKGTEADKLFKQSDMDFPHIDYEEEDDEDEDEDAIPKDTPYDKIFGYPEESKEELQDEDMSEEQEEEYEGQYPPSEPTEDTRSPCDKITKDKTPADDEIYREMGAVVNGHTIIIRVLKKRKKEKPVIDEKIEENPFCLPEPPVCPFAPKLNVCDCDFPLPPDLTPRCPPPSCCMSSPQSPPCCMSLPPLPPPCCKSSPSPTLNQLPSGYSCTSPNNTQGKTYKSQNSLACPKYDCLNLPISCNSLNMEPKKPIDLELGTVAMKGDDVFFQSSSKPGEPLNDKEKKLTDSLYFKAKCKGRSNDTVDKGISGSSPLSVGEPGNGIQSNAIRHSNDSKKRKSVHCS